MSTTIDTDNDVVVLAVDVVDIKGDKGAKGDKGDTGNAATVSVGTVTTLEANQQATVSNVGTTSAAVFNFAIPKGPKGDTGATGAKGDKGDKGDSGNVSAEFQALAQQVHTDAGEVTQHLAETRINSQASNTYAANAKISENNAKASELQASADATALRQFIASVNYVSIAPPLSLISEAYIMATPTIAQL